MKKMWVSKQDHKPEANEINYKSHMKERVRHMEKQQEYDSYLIAKEYDDDYDDQFDENIAARKVPAPDLDSLSFQPKWKAYLWG